jgi:hypothetical protein
MESGPGTRRQMIRLSTAICAFLLASAAFAQPLPWRLTPSGLGPVLIGMTRTQVEHALHVRLRLNYPPDSDDNLCREMSPTSLQKGLIFMFEDGHLTRISLVKPSKIATVKGIRVGATESQVERAYGRQLRAEPNHYDDPPAQYLTVWTDPGKRGLRFETDGNRRVYVIHAGTSSIQYIEGCL